MNSKELIPNWQVSQGPIPDWKVSKELIPAEVRSRLVPLPVPRMRAMEKVDRALLLLLDVSGSMGEQVDTAKRAGPSKLNVAWQAFRGELQGRLLDWHLGILLFGTTTQEGDGVQWLMAPTNQVELDKLPEPSPGTDTPLLPALEKAWAWLSSRAASGRLVVISDGLPNQGGGPEAVLEAAGKHSTIPIDTVGLGGYGDVNFLQKLSAITGGRFTLAKAARELFAAILALSPAERPLLGPVR